jgi:hypothetical protein
MSVSPQRERLVRPGIRFEVPELNILSFDPGGTTGVTALTYGGGGWSDEISLDDFTVRGFSLGPDEHHLALLTTLTAANLDADPPLVIVTESFSYRQYATDQKQGERGNGAATVSLISVEYIGIMKLYAQHAGVEYFEYSPADCKSFVTDMKLRAMGWFMEPATPMRHINDSKRPLVNYLVRQLRLNKAVVDTWRG